MIVFQVSLNFVHERNTENTMPDLYFNEESDYPEEHTRNNENFCSTILQSFQFEPEQKKASGNESHEKKLEKQSFASLDLQLY